MMQSTWYPPLLTPSIHQSTSLFPSARALLASTMKTRQQLPFFSHLRPLFLRQGRWSHRPALPLRTVYKPHPVRIISFLSLFLEIFLFPIDLDGERKHKRNKKKSRWVSGKLFMLLSLTISSTESIQHLNWSPTGKSNVCTRVTFRMTANSQMTERHFLKTFWHWAQSILLIKIRIYRPLEKKGRFFSSWNGRKQANGGGNWFDFDLTFWFWAQSILRIKIRIYHIWRNETFFKTDFSSWNGRK